MNKKIVLLAGLVVLGLAVAMIMLRSSDSSPQGSGQARSIFEMFSRSGGDSATSVLMSGNNIDYNDFMRKLRSGEVNFIWELWAMRAKCDEPSTPEQCDEAIIAHIEKNLPSPEKEQLVGLFRKYFSYEAKMREFDLSKANNFEQRYALIKGKRRELLGPEDSQLIFGMEESQIDFIDLARQNVESTKELSGDERVRQYEALKKKTYGPYYKAVVGREDSFANYQTELELRQGDFAKYDAAERDQRTAEIQKRYFGKDAALAIAKARKEELAEQRRMADYQKKEQEFLSQNASLSEEKKQAGLRDLRVQVLGADEAAAYERRLKFEADIGKIK